MAVVSPVIASLLRHLRWVESAVDEPESVYDRLTGNEINFC